MCWRSIKSLLEICQLQAVHAVKSAQAKQGNPTPTSMSRLCPRYNWDIVFMESKPCRNNFNECCTSGPPEHYYLVAALSKQFQVPFFFFFPPVNHYMKGILSNFCHHCHVIVFICFNKEQTQEMKLIIELKNGRTADNQSAFDPSVCAEALNGAIRDAQAPRAR